MIRNLFRRVRRLFAFGRNWCALDEEFQRILDTCQKTLTLELAAIRRARIHAEQELQQIRSERRKDRQIKTRLNSLIRRLANDFMDLCPQANIDDCFNRALREAEDQGFDKAAKSHEAKDGPSTAFPN